MLHVEPARGDGPVRRDVPSVPMLTFGGRDPSAAPGRARRIVRRAAAVGALASLAVAVLSPGARAQTDDEAPLVLPDSFVGAASARGIGMTLLTPALVPVNDLFDLAVAEGRGTYESANQEARASLLFPGNGLVMGASLLCGTFGSSIPSEGQLLFGPILDTCLGYQYPLAVFADSLNPEAQTEGAATLGAATDPVSMRAAGARAHAALDATTTDAEVTDFRVIGAPALGSLDSLLALAGTEPTDANLVAVESVTAHTDQRIVDGALVVDSRATVSGLRLLGGLVRIGSVVSHSRVVSLPGAEPVVEAGIEASGVEVAGSPAQLTDQGLVVGDPSAPSGPVDQQVASQAAAILEGADFRVETLEVEQADIDGIPYASAGGLLIEFSTPLEGLPPLPSPIGDLDVNGAYGVRMVLGSTGARGFADSFGDAPLTSGGRSPAVSPTGGSSVGGTGGSRLPAVSPSPAAGPAPAPAATPDAPAAPDLEPAGTLADVFADRMPFLYLAFTLTALALCLTPRLTLPARLPGAGPA